MRALLGAFEAEGNPAEVVRVHLVCDDVVFIAGIRFRLVQQRYSSAADVIIRGDDLQFAVFH